MTLHQNVAAVKASAAAVSMEIRNMPKPRSEPTPTDPTEIAENLQSLFAQFQEANDERIQGIENRFDDVVTNEKVDAINAAITETQETLQAALDDQARRIARLQVSGGGDGERQLRNHAARTMSIASNQRIRPEDADVDAYRNYCSAFEQLVLVEGNVEAIQSQDIRAALSVGSDRDGGYLVPDEMSTEMERRIFETSPMRSISRVISTNRGAWVAPAKASQFASGGWVGEKQARPATATGEFIEQRIPSHEQYAYPEVTQEMLDDAAINVESFIMDETEDVMSRTENTGLVTGNGVLKPRGFMDYKDTAVTTDDATRAWGALQYVPSGAAGSFATLSGIPGAADADPLLTLMSKLNPAYRTGAVFTMKRATEAAVRKLKDGDGRYLIGFGDLRDNAFGFSLLGTPIVNLEDMADIAPDSYPIAYGNFRRGYYIVDRTGFRLIRDPLTNKPYVGFYISKRVGGDVRNFDAIKLMKFATS